MTTRAAESPAPKLLLHHVAAVAEDIQPLQKLFAVLGLPTSPARYSAEWEAELVEVECAPASMCLWRPTTPDSPMARWLKKRGGPGLHHIMFDVEDLPSAIEWLKARNVRFLGDPKKHPRQHQPFIDPSQAHGALIELGETGGANQSAPIKPGEPKLDHVSWAVEDMEAARSFFEVLGLEVTPASEDMPVFGCRHAGVRTTPGIQTS